MSRKINGKSNFFYIGPLKFSIWGEVLGLVVNPSWKGRERKVMFGRSEMKVCRCGYGRDVMRVGIFGLVVGEQKGPLAFGLAQCESCWLVVESEDEQHGLCIGIFSIDC